MIRDRPTAEHIMTVLEAKKGIGMRFSDVNRAMIDEGHIHTCSAMADNFKVLIKRGKIVKVDRYYGIPNVREDGTRYLIVVQPDNTKRMVECGKVRQDGK